MSVSTIPSISRIPARSGALTAAATLRRLVLRLAAGAAGILRDCRALRALREMQRLDDWILRDIGLDRADIGQAVNGTARQRRQFFLTENHRRRIASTAKGDIPRRH